MSFLCTFDAPVVETKAGKLRGFEMDGIYQFRGVPYAEAERFLPPTPVKPWEGIRDVSMYGPVCLTINRPGLKPYGMDFGMRYWPQSENCQVLNVWTPALDETAKKPVMFWIHGGGFSDGSSLELVSYDGENLSREGDVVVVSINHRLNILGYFNLSEFGEKYALSGTVGMADIVMALEWVRDNIARFGGDPDNVTIFGQSGGGMKVDTLMQMPAAAGLFHKAIIESGITDFIKKDAAEDSRKVTHAVVEELGLTPDTIDEIQRVPYETLADAWKRAAAKLSAEGVSVDWSPIPNAEYPGDPMFVGFSEKAKTTPLIVGGVVAEQLLWRGKIYDPADPEETKLQRVRAFYGEGAELMLEEFKKAYPDKDVNDLMYVDSRFRKPAIDYIAARVQVAKAPTYSWMLTYDFPIYGGLPAWHGSNHALTFNQCIAPVFHEPGSQRLAVQMSQSYAAFAHTGDPNHSEIPAWHPCEPGREAVMCFDAVCEEKVNYDHDLMSAHVQYAPPLNLRPKF